MAWSEMTLMKPIYLDYAATTPVDPRVAKRMQAYLTLDGDFGNPASLHSYGKEARDAVEMARSQVADLVQADKEEIIWTSGATEANNLAIKGAAYLYQRKGKHIITVKTEHKAVLDTCQQLEKEGYHVTYLAPLANGLIDLNQLEEAIRDDTIIISVMQVNNEIGVIQDIDAISKITSTRHIVFHVDAAQSTGKVDINLRKTPIDLMSFCAHKTYGPKGIGALYLRKKPRVRVEPLIHGGGHEQGMRSGTLATHQIVGMGEAMFLAKQEMNNDYQQIAFLRERFLKGLSTISNIILTIPKSVPHILNLRFDGMIADAILAQLPNIAASTASACQGKGTEGSYVLRALGLTIDQSKSALRLSFGRFTTEEQIDCVVDSFQRLFCRR
jgi:cysteine desulfurase